MIHRKKKTEYFRTCAFSLLGLKSNTQIKKQIHKCTYVYVYILLYKKNSRGTVVIFSLFETKILTF